MAEMTREEREARTKTLLKRAARPPGAPWEQRAEPGVWMPEKERFGTYEEIEREHAALLPVEYQRMDEPVPTQEDVEHVSEVLERLPQKVSPEEIAELKEFAERKQFRVQEIPNKAKRLDVEVFSADGGRAVCLRRPTLYIVQEKKKAGKTINSVEKLSPKQCRTFPRSEMKCINEKRGADACEQVAQVFDCARKHSGEPTSTVHITNLLGRDSDEVSGCIDDLERKGDVEETGDVLGEKTYFMPHPFDFGDKKLVWEPSTRERPGRYVLK